ncbi:MAG: hypothetical protein IT328_20180 [Caldilineaceae bacterium]|nr:hypothetical protein [Caldilineaceae bacterium]
MPDRSYVYRVEVDGRSAGPAAAQIRSVLERELGRVRFTPTVAAPRTVAAVTGSALPSFVPSRGVSGRGSREVIPGMGMVGGLAGYTVAGFAISQLGRMAVNTTMELTKQGTALRRSDFAAQQLAGSTNRLNTLLQVYQKATGDTQTSGEAMAKVSQLMAIGFADSEEELRKFVTASRGAAAATGQDLAYIQSQLQLTIANQSTMRLDQIGLGITEVKDRVSELKETMPGLSDEARYQEAVLGLLNEKFGGLANSAEVGASGLELLLKQMRELNEEAARYVEQRTNPIFESLAVGLGSENTAARANHLRRMADSNSGDVVNFLSGGEAGRQGAAMGRTADLLLELDAAMTKGVPGAAALMKQVQELANALIDSGFATEDQIEKAQQLEIAYGLLLTGGVQLAAQQEETAESTANTSEEMIKLATETAATAGELGYLVNAAWSAGAGLDDLGDRADILAGKLANVRAQNAGLVALEQTLAKAIVGAGQDVSQYVGPVEARRMIDDTMGQLEMAREDWRRQGITDPIEIALLETTLKERLLGPMQNVVEMNEEAIREAERAQKEGARNNEAAWKRAANATERAFRDAANELESQIRQIPGLFGASSVTDEQMKMAELGVPQNFADNYLRRLTDEVMNGVDWEGVDIADAAARAGIDQALDPKAILAMFTQKWGDQSLFANAANLDLFDQEAIRAEMERQRQSKLGGQNILSMFGLGEDGDGAFFTGLGSTIAGGMMSGAEEGLADFGQQAIQGVMAQLANDSALREYANLGAQQFGAMEQGWLDAAGESNFVTALVGIVMAQINDTMEGRQ